MHLVIDMNRAHTHAT